MKELQKCLSWPGSGPGWLPVQALLALGEHQKERDPEFLAHAVELYMEALLFQGPDVPKAPLIPLLFDHCLLDVGGISSMMVFLVNLHGGTPDDQENSCRWVLVLHGPAFFSQAKAYH